MWWIVPKAIPGSSEYVRSCWHLAMPIMIDSTVTQSWSPFFYYAMDNHRLKTWLQLHPATDTSAVINLPFFSTVSPKSIFPQGHAQKWTIRINSLMHSKDPGARWAGLSIMLRMATLSGYIMNKCAHAWVTVALPILFMGLNTVDVLANSEDLMSHHL